MNDLVFSLVYENAKPEDGQVINRPWYVVVPEETRQALNRWLSDAGIRGNLPFHVARVVTLIVFMGLYGWLCLLWRRDSTEVRFLSSVFLLIAVFFMLQPTQNPWYWLWALPFVCFAVNRGWLTVAPLLFIYYLRFWFETWDGSVEFAGIEYRSEGVFDFLIVFVEYGLMALALVVVRLWLTARGRRRKHKV